MTRLTFAIVLLVLASAIFVFGLFPAWSGVQMARAEIQKLIRLNDELQEIARIRDDLTAQYNAIPQSDLNKLSAMLPSGFGSAQFLRDMEALATKYGMFLKNIDFVTKEKTQTTQIQLPVQRLVASIDVSFNARGSYESFRSYLKDLEKMARIIDISDISFSGVQLAVEKGPVLLEYSMKGVTYYLR